MNLRETLLAAVVVVELAVGGGLVVWRRSLPAPPVPDLGQTDPLAAETIRERARTCREAGDWAKLAEAYQGYGYFTEAARCYKQAVALEPGRPDRAHELAFALERLGMIEEANASYSRAVELGDRRPEACWYFVGRNRLRLEDPSAEAAFRRAGEHYASQLELARLTARGGHPAEAREALRQLDRDYPNAAQVLYQLNRIDIILNNENGAARWADRAERAGDRLPTPFDREWKRLEDAHDRIGEPRLRREAEESLAAGKRAEAELRVRRALAAAWSPEATDLLAEIELQSGRPHEAVKLLEEAIDRAGVTVHLLERLGDTHQEMGRVGEAVQAWTRATTLAQGPEVKDVHYKLATTFERLKNAERSRHHLARAYLAAGRELLDRGKVDDAREPLEKAVEIEPGLVPAWFYLGETQRQREEVPAARRAYQKCLEFEPEHGRAHAALGLLEP
jgi:tetratricopeptide (TPR) repeat protein